METMPLLIRERSELAQFLNKLLREDEKSRIAIVPTKAIREKLQKNTSAFTQWMIPETFDYKLRFRTEEILTYPEIVVIGSDVLEDPYRGPKLEFSLLRTHFYNPLIDILPVKIPSEDILFEETFNQRLVPFVNIKDQLKKRVLSFFIVSTRRDMLIWSSILKKSYSKILAVSSSLPSRLIEKMLSLSKKESFPLITTKGMAFDLASRRDKLIFLPSLSRNTTRNICNEDKGFRLEDMCLLLAFERRINNKDTISRLLSEYYSCTPENVVDCIESLISRGILFAFPSGTITPTFLGKTVVRNFLSVETSFRMLEANKSICNEKEMLSLVYSLPEFSREKLILEALEQLSCPEAINTVLQLDITRKAIWLLNGISRVLVSLQNSKTIQTAKSISKKMKRKRLSLLSKIEEIIKKGEF